ncbi:threonine dehydrogenase [Longilinea arvoryzae]|uniref:Threonine dehydrogenase n=1 Tax=Longilinea arvoryzae TaxID=360412 RepID=A0A0S7B755_9CHLR|nr:alcohol dehydrogenase catalytic domain-containing protein [Longilinea arvoryzae]GAP13148.1 threonine dehydrogenase [Longilinea arvoryzae]
MKMLAFRYHGPNDMRLEEVEAPQVAVGELIVEMESASFCGTDLRIVHGNHRHYPAGTVRTPGHELVGRISQIGEGVKGYELGQRVFVAPNIGCGHCEECISGNNNLCTDFNALGITLDGAFAQSVRVPANAVKQGNIMPIGENVDPAVAALIEPFACVLRGQRPLNIQPGEVVLVMGAGPIGIMHLKLARLKGAGQVIVSEPVAERREQAAAFGADRVVDPFNEDLKAVLQANSHGRGADAIIIAAPVNALQEQSLDLAAVGGRISFFGGLPKDKPTIQFNSNLVHYKELIVSATTACSTDNCRQAANIVNSGRVDLSPLVSARVRLADAAEGLRLAEDRKSLKVVLVP